MVHRADGTHEHGETRYYYGERVEMSLLWCMAPRVYLKERVYRSVRYLLIISNKLQMDENPTIGEA